MDFSKWFDGASGYALHRPRPIRLTGCCLQAQPDGRQVWLPFSEESQPVPCPLYRCPSCGRLYASREGVWYPISNPLRYHISKKNSDL